MKTEQLIKPIYLPYLTTPSDMFMLKGSVLPFAIKREEKEATIIGLDANGKWQHMCSLDEREDSIAPKDFHFHVVVCGDAASVTNKTTGRAYWIRAVEGKCERSEEVVLPPDCTLFLGGKSCHSYFLTSAGNTVVELTYADDSKRTVASEASHRLGYRGAVTGSLFSDSFIVLYKQAMEERQIEDSEIMCVLPFDLSEKRTLKASKIPIPENSLERDVKPLLYKETLLFVDRNTAPFDKKILISYHIPSGRQLQFPFDNSAERALVGVLDSDDRIRLCVAKDDSLDLIEMMEIEGQLVPVGEGVFSKTMVEKITSNVTFDDYFDDHIFFMTKHSRRIFQLQILHDNFIISRWTGDRWLETKTFHVNPGEHKPIVSTTTSLTVLYPERCCAYTIEYEDERFIMHKDKTSSDKLALYVSEEKALLFNTEGKNILEVHRGPFSWPINLPPLIYDEETYLPIVYPYMTDLERDTMVLGHKIIKPPFPGVCTSARIFVVQPMRQKVALDLYVDGPLNDAYVAEDWLLMKTENALVFLNLVNNEIKNVELNRKESEYRHAQILGWYRNDNGTSDVYWSERSDNVDVSNVFRVTICLPILSGTTSDMESALNRQKRCDENDKHRELLRQEPKKVPSNEQVPASE